MNDDDRERYFENERSFRAAVPWAFVKPACDRCVASLKGACQEHHFVTPKHVLPGAPAPGDIVPCAGKWKQHDSEWVTPEVTQRCAGCPFFDWCLRTAVANDEHGLWAGTNSDDRRALRARTERTGREAA